MNSRANSSSPIIVALVSAIKRAAVSVPYTAGSSPPGDRDKVNFKKALNFLILITDAKVRCQSILFYFLLFFFNSFFKLVL
ncbi:hypothetical protein WN944_024416 [Citrus x changshan-huyou]|uniref:Uncharacterized protein n=1 Tax=Citrus x changshan-huyou TaxID=2935761 RepID=A0AAP0QC18_9ROSI